MHLVLENMLRPHFDDVINLKLVFLNTNPHTKIVVLITFGLGIE